ncbi:alginate export family protein [Winogradskyella aquimaris]|uniref:Alginate export domain-containing protein n=1 Tax=Winogradskyella aquimaris TaxID=864074 RepID=A0ABU5EPN3_9FLAO|nr:hypothetical protein [Winogradskyella aquimaris]MDY2586831.1 hypothetical protein [Winogradskyella aquimaris]
MKPQLLLRICFIVSSIGLWSQETNFLTLHNSEKFKVQGTLQFGANAVAETNLFWNLADVPELDFDSDTQWLESYIKPGVGFTWLPSESNTSKFYGKVSIVASSTLGTDAFDEGDTGRTTIEEAHLGYKFNLNETSSLDLSLGSQELKLGTGMLIANGGVSGFERGALKLGPRKAWEMTAIGKLKTKDLNITGFYIDPNELPSNDTRNELAGFDVNLYKSANKYIGLSYIHVTSSNAPYPQATPNGPAPITITFGDREDLNALNFYGKSYPFKNELKDVFTTIDFAYQWNSRIDLNSWGGRAQIGYDIKKWKWRPTVMLSYQIFSGDDPSTSGQERFDPLYYEGSPSAWSTGSKSSMVFINSNVKAFGFSVRTMPSPKDILTFRYNAISAHKLRSPLQFGQAARVDFADGEGSTVIAGVTEKPLADDFFLEYNRIINQNIFFNVGFSMSFAGKGITSIRPDVSTWTGGFANIVFNY